MWECETYAPSEGGELLSMKEQVKVEKIILPALLMKIIFCKSLDRITKADFNFV